MTKAISEPKNPKNVKKTVKDAKKPIEKAIACKGIKKKRTVVERNARQADALADYKNSQAAEAEICCYYCVKTVEDRKTLMFGGVRNPGLS